MAIDFGTDAGDPLLALARILAGIDIINAHRGTGGDSLGDIVDQVVGDLSVNFADLDDGLWAELEGWRGAAGGAVSSLAERFRNVFRQVVHRDSPLLQVSNENALREFIRQMAAGTESVAPNVVACTVTADAGNTGDPDVVVSLKRSADGRTAQYVYPESIVLTVTSDQQTGATVGNEPYSYTGAASVTDPLSYLWPGGSGASGNITTAVLATADDTAALGTPGGNLLINGDFENQTANIPDDWELFDGTAGTDILTEASTVYSGTKAVEFLGQDPATTPGLSFTIDRTKVQPNDVLHFSLRVRKSASLAAGVLQASLVNGSNVIIDDDQGDDLAATIAHGSISSAAWTKFSGSFVLPSTLPSTIKFVLEVSTALTDAESAFLDWASLTIADAPIYSGGPRITVHSGTTAVVEGDRFVAAVSNNLAGAWQTHFWRLFPELVSGDLQILSAAAEETIDDALIALA